jgi:hypothetical protein
MSVSKENVVKKWKKLSGEEYDKAVTSLYEIDDRYMTMSAKRSHEIDLTISHLLGLDFPVKRRKAIKKALGKINRRLFLKHVVIIVRGFFDKQFIPETGEFARVTRECLGEVLSDDELNDYLGEWIKSNKLI